MNPTRARRRRRLLVVGLWLLLVSACTHTPTTAGGLLTRNLSSATLPNGLRVVLLEDHAIPIVAVAVDYSVGSADQPAGRIGFAHLFEHLMSEGSRHISRDVQDRVLEQAGGDDDARTDYDYTELVSVGPSDSLETMLWLQSDRMGFLLPGGFGQERLEIQKQVVANERRQRIDDVPAARARELLMRTVFPEKHAYHDLVIGPSEPLAGVDIVGATAFYEENYAPSNAVVVIVGDFQESEARALVKKYFGSLPARRRADPRERVPAVPMHTTSFTTIDAGSDEHQVWFGWATPPAFSAMDPAVDLAWVILGSGPGSRLKEVLVDRDKLAANVDCGYRRLRLASVVLCQVDLRPGVEARRAVEAVNSVLSELGSVGPSAADVTRAKLLWNLATVKALEPLRGRATRLAWYATAKGEAGAIVSDEQAHGAVTHDSVRAAFRDYISPNHASIVERVRERQ